MSWSYLDVLLHENNSTEKLSKLVMLAASFTQAFQKKLMRPITRLVSGM